LKLGEPQRHPEKRLTTRARAKKATAGVPVLKKGEETIKGKL